MRYFAGLAALFLLLAMATASLALEASSHPDGFWKVPPPQKVHAEFSGEDPIGLSARQHIPTDCSIVFKDRSEGKAYCFSSPMSALTFQDDQTDILAKAKAFWSAAQTQK